jgi:NADH-quinone oxidoreductase subunit M
MNTDTIWLLTILGAPLVGAVVLSLLGRRGMRASGWVAVAASALSLIAVFALLPSLERGVTPAFRIRWIPATNISLALRLDWLTFPFVLTEAAVTLIAALYSLGYHHQDESSSFFYALLMLFAVGMSGTTLADATFLFYIFWELMLLASAILIAIWGEGERRTAITMKYFIFTHFGSLMVLVGLIVLFNASGTDSFSALRVGVDLASSLVGPVIALFLVGFSVKMAIFPLHLWLPDAHTVAPMPVTIMLAAAMLSMGTYGVLRFPMSVFTRADMVRFAVPMMVAGIISEVYGALMALAAQDIKRIIAYSSVSQMGYILFGLGTLSYNGVLGATLHVIYHATVKALLFMCAGIVIRATKRRRINELGGLREAMPVLAVCTGVAALAIAGTPPFSVFDSEWMIFSGGFSTAHIGLSVLTLFGSLFTVAYALWLFGRIFFGTRPKGLSVDPVPWLMLAPTVFLAVLSLVEGLIPAPVFAWVSRELPLILGGSW